MYENCFFRIKNVVKKWQLVISSLDSYISHVLTSGRSKTNEWKIFRRFSLKSIQNGINTCRSHAVKWFRFMVGLDHKGFYVHCVSLQLPYLH